MLRNTFKMFGHEVLNENFYHSFFSLLFSEYFPSIVYNYFQFPSIPLLNVLGKGNVIGRKY